MSELQFKGSMFKLAAKVKRGELTETEKELIVEAFNKKSGSAYERAVKSIEEVIGVDNVEMIIEKSASLDNINRLLQDLQSAASSWETK